MTQLTEKEQLARPRICLPLDNIDYVRDSDIPANAPPGTVSVESRVKELGSFVGLYKIGMESFTGFGPDLVRYIQGLGADVFLDLKYKDIPNTVKGSAKKACKLGVVLFNVHADGGEPMLKAAYDGVKDSGKDPSQMIAGVTVLTSLGPAEYLDTHRALVPHIKHEELVPFYGMKTSERDKDIKLHMLLRERGYEHLTGDHPISIITDEVVNLAHMCHRMGIEGIVCSAEDLLSIKDNLPSGMWTVTPGLTAPGIPAGKDQVRVVYVEQAMKMGVRYAVIGRAITEGKTPEERQERAYKILQNAAQAF